MHKKIQFKKRVKIKKVLIFTQILHLLFNYLRNDANSSSAPCTVFSLTFAPAAEVNVYFKSLVSVKVLSKSLYIS